MEDILSRILKDAPSSKFPQLRQSCLEAQALLTDQFELNRAEPFELREKCLSALQQSLESKSPKLIVHAVKGFQEIVRDKSFQASFESEDEERWLPSQLVKSLASALILPEDVQLELLKVLLQLAYASGWYLGNTGVLNLLRLYKDLNIHGSGQVKTAAMATASQTLQAYITFLQEVDLQQQTTQIDERSESDDDCNRCPNILDDILPILRVLCQSLSEPQSNNNNNNKRGSASSLSGAFMLQCILVVLRSLKIDVHSHEGFIKFLWQEICPAMVSLLGCPQSDCHITSSSSVQAQSSDSTSIGRGSGSIATSSSSLSANAKIIYNISLELVRLIGPVGSLRPVLASLFHRMMLYPATPHRTGVLRALRELFSKPELVVKFAGPPLFDDKCNRQQDLDLLRIAMDCLLECCHSPESAVCCSAVSCVLSLVSSVEQLVEGEGLTDAHVTLINSIYRTLTEAQAENPSDRRRISSNFEQENLTKLDNHPQEITTLHENIFRNNCALYDDMSSEESISDDQASEDSAGVKNSVRTPIEIEAEPSNKILRVEEAPDTLESVPEIDLGKLEQITSDRVSPSNNSNHAEVEDNQVVEVNSEFGDLTREKASSELKEPEENGMDESVVSETALENRLNEVLGSRRSLYISACEDLDGLGAASEEMDTVSESQEQICSNRVDEMEEDPWVDRSESMSSSTTEGPEEDFDMQEFQRNLEAEELHQTAMEQARRNKAPRTLLAEEDGRTERARAERLCLQQDSFAKAERQNASHFVDSLSSSLPRLLSMRTSIGADQALQEFASNYCEETWQLQHTENESAEQPVTILNADGIYLASYSSLLLNIKLIRSGYFPDCGSSPMLSESEFIEEVHGSGVLVYLSATWLSEVYQHLLCKNLLLEAGYDPLSEANSALINLLSDVDGLGSTEQGGQLLSDYRRLDRSVSTNHSSPTKESGKKLARVLLTGSFGIILEVLSVLLNGTNDCGVAENLGLVLGTEGAREEQRRTKEAVTQSLEGLQKTAKLCNLLGLQNSCGSVFEQLALASCPDIGPLGHPMGDSKRRKHGTKGILPWSGRSLNLHASHVLSLEIILAKGLELASHSPQCWRHLFRCCLYVMNLEHSYFSVFSRTSANHTTTTSSATRWSGPKDNGLILPSFDIDDYRDVQTTVFPVEMVNLSEVVRSTCPQSGLLRDRQLQPIIEGLSQLVDKLFETSSTLNLSALVRFLAELCAASQEQLFIAPAGPKNRRSLWWRTLASKRAASKEPSRGSEGLHSLLLMHRVADVMLRCSKGGRPLLHVMKAWSIAAPHFVEAACHKDRAISHKSVASIHDIVSALLSSHPELSHFHCNEALFKPFENLLCLELCDTDIQEQIICSMCEFVESCTVEVRSGWRPLFGALRAVRLPQQQGVTLEADQTRYLRVVLDVFNAFFVAQNVLVFANAAVDCLLCLLKHVKGPVEGIYEKDSEGVTLDLCLAALNYLEICSNILASLYQMPACPVFSSANRIQLQKEPAVVDSTFLDSFLEIGEHPEIIETLLKEKWDSTNLPEERSGILPVWLLLLEGLVGSVPICPERYQAQTIQMLFGMLNKIKEVPGPAFGIYCVNHLLLPMLQSWLRKITGPWEDFTSSFKQCCGHATDLVGDYLILLTEQGQLNQVPGARLMLYQLYLVLIECISKSVESISRMGCACIRHIISSAGHTFTESLWDVTCWALYTSCWISLRDVHHLCQHFCTGSQNFYGDIGQVKVAARSREDKVEDILRLNQLAQQVLLLECQAGAVTPADLIHEDRSFVFLLTPEQEDMQEVTRVPFDSLVIGLVSHQLLLQSLCSLLIGGSRFSLPGLCPPPLSSPIAGTKTQSSNTLPGLLGNLTETHRTLLLECLRDSYSVAAEFDSRPGLKFLVQKVAGWPVASNLYRQAGTSWSVCVLSLLEICLSQQVSKGHRSLEATNQALREQPSFPGEKNVSPFVQLRECLMEMSGRYADLAMQKEEGQMMDRVASQPVFFISLKEADFSQICPSLAPKLQNSTKLETLSPTQDGEPPEEGQLQAEEVYRVATQSAIQGMVSDYKRRKNQQCLPQPGPQLQQHRNSKCSSSSSDSSVPEDIQKQRVNSILKDSEAHEQVLTQLMQSILELHLSLEEVEGESDLFGCLLPVFFPVVQSLVAQAQDRSLRDTLSHWLHRMGLHRGIMLPPTHTPES